MIQPWLWAPKLLHEPPPSAATSSASASLVPTQQELFEALPTFRPDTNDAIIFRTVVELNEYRLPERFAAQDTVIDIGAHIGSFSIAVLSRGAGRVIAFEVDKENCALARANLSRYGQRADVRNLAVWRSDIAEPYLDFVPSANAVDTGGGNVLGFPGQSGRRVKAQPFDEIAREAAGIGRIRLVKLDCEGAEFPILYTATTLNLVDEIVGEYHRHEWDGYEERHGFGVRFDIESLAAHLRTQGFEVSWVETGNEGIFFARR